MTCVHTYNIPNILMNTTQSASWVSGVDQPLRLTTNPCYKAKELSIPHCSCLHRSSIILGNDLQWHAYIHTLLIFRYSKPTLPCMLWTTVVNKNWPPWNPVAYARWSWCNTSHCEEMELYHWSKGSGSTIVTMRCLLGQVPLYLPSEWVAII